MSLLRLRPHAAARHLCSCARPLTPYKQNPVVNDSNMHINTVMHARTIHWAIHNNNITHQQLYLYSTFFNIFTKGFPVKRLDRLNCKLQRNDGYSGVLSLGYSFTQKVICFCCVSNRVTKGQKCSGKFPETFQKTFHGKLTLVLTFFSFSFFLIRKYGT